MSIRQGNKIISGGDRLPGWGTPLLSCMWADHKLNSVSWLRADTFSWQSGNVYISAYNHLVEDLHDSGTTIHTEVISGNTITYYLTPDKHRICLGDQAQTVDAIYQATGISWYFILDEGKKRFKLPRTKWGFTGLRNGAGENVEAGLPNITGDIVVYTATYGDSSASGAFEKFDGTGRGESYQYAGNNQGYSFDASRSSSVYGKSTTVQPPATEMYLYFYVGNFDVNKDILDTSKLSELVNEFNITEFEAEVQESKNKAISEISTIYPEVAKYPGMITNCITEIPQDIKLTLNNGTLTLKAGSKVYAPNGAGVFDSVPITVDLVMPTIPGTKQIIAYVVAGGTSINWQEVGTVSSGATDSLAGTEWHLWYDRSNNIIKRYGDSGAFLSSGHCFPIALCTVTSGVITSIDQVFNGFGYIGSTVFTLPGVKGVYPNGRNVDGTLKNGNINCTTVQLSSNFNDSRDASLLIDSKGQCKWYSTTGWYYDEVNNIMYSTHDNAVLHHANLGTFTVLMGNISNFNNDTVFRAADYNDLVKKQDADTSINYNNITNCITDIPQDIKLELSSDGVLTLKAGSKVYVPNGAGVFDELVIASDIVYPRRGVDTLVLVIRTDTLEIKPTSLQFVSSGNSNPQAGTTYNLWYDTTNNVVKKYEADTSTPAYTASLPFAIIKVGADKIESIDQVFNGFGYIGSTIFALPGVKALVPDGRNEDGSLKNIESTLRAVRCMHMESWMVGRTNAPLTLDPVYGVTGVDVDYSYWGSVAYLKDLARAYKYYSLWYCAEDNKMHYFNGSAVESIAQRTFVGSFNVDSNNNIASLNIKQSFHSVDYSDTCFIANQAMPEPSSYVEWTLGATGTNYIAPSDGYFVFTKTTDAVNQYVAVASGATREICFCPVSGFRPSVMFPCSKGQSINVAYTAGGALSAFGFVYANGSK